MKIFFFFVALFVGVGLYLKLVAFPIFDSGIIARIIDNEICEISILARIILGSIAVILTLVFFPGGIFVVFFLVSELIIVTFE